MLVKGSLHSILSTPLMDTSSDDMGLLSCLLAEVMTCLRHSFDYFILEHFVGDGLFSKMPFLRRHLAFPDMPPFLFLFSEYSFSGVQWQCSNPLNLTYIKEWKRVKITPFCSVLYCAFVNYKEKTASEFFHFYLCFIFTFGSIKSWYTSPLFHEDFLENFAPGSIQSPFLKGRLSLFLMCLLGILVLEVLIEIK